MTTELTLTAGEANILLAILQKTQDNELWRVYNTARKTAKRAVLAVTPEEATRLSETLQSYIDQEEDLVVSHKGQNYPHPYAEYSPHAKKALKKISNLKFFISSSHTGTVVF